MENYKDDKWDLTMEEWNDLWSGASINKDDKKEEGWLSSHEGELPPISPVPNMGSVDNEKVEGPKEPENQVGGIEPEHSLTPTTEYSFEKVNDVVLESERGLVSSMERTPDVVVARAGVELGIEPPKKPFDNKQTEDYVERLNNLIAAYTDYKSLLKTFGKDNIKDVLLEAKQNDLLLIDIDRTDIKISDINPDGPMKN